MNFGVISSWLRDRKPTLELIDRYASIFAVDSNIILECKPLQEVDWSELAPRGSVLILFVPTVLKEIDLKKSDGRLAVRARDFNRTVGNLLLSKQPNNFASGAVQVDVCAARCRKIAWNKLDLDRSQGDHRIVAELISLRDFPLSKFSFLTNDTNAGIVASDAGIDVKRPPDSWQRPPESSPHDKENAKLKARLKELEKTQPEFNVNVSTPVETLTLFKVEPLSKLEAAELLDAIRRINPRTSQEPYGFSFNYDPAYDQKFDEYRDKKLPKFISSLSGKLEVLFGQREISINIENIGSVAAEHAVFEVRVVGGWLNDGPILTNPSGPSPPHVEPGYMHHLLPHNNFPAIKRIVGRHEVSIGEFARAETVVAECEDFRCGQNWQFKGVIWTDPRVSETKVVVLITATNLSGTISEKRIFERVVNSRKIADLVDLKKLQLLEDPSILESAKLLISKNETSKITWDN